MVEEGGTCSMELLTKGGTAMVTSLEMPNEGAKEAKLGTGRKGKEKRAVCMGGYKDGQGEDIVSETQLKPGQCPPLILYHLHHTQIPHFPINYLFFSCLPYHMGHPSKMCIEFT